MTSNGIIKLGDFGVAKVLNETQEFSETPAGTPYYIAPEIIEGFPYSFPADIWSLGILLYEMCALRPPFDASSPFKLQNKIVSEGYDDIPKRFSDDTRNLIAKMLDKNPKNRPRIHKILREKFI